MNRKTPLNEQSETFIKHCYICGMCFKTPNRQTAICEQCKAREKKLRQASKNEEHKKPKVVAHYRPAADVGLFRIVRIIDRYNAEHGTHYSYEQFMELVRNKKINLRQEVLNHAGLSKKTQ